MACNRISARSAGRVQSTYSSVACPGVNTLMTAIEESVRNYSSFAIEECLLIKGVPLVLTKWCMIGNTAAWNHMITRHNARRDRCFNRTIGISVMIRSRRREVRLFLTDWLGD
jgi:hypothetical protein